MTSCSAISEPNVLETIEGIQRELDRLHQKLVGKASNNDGSIFLSKDWRQPKRESVFLFGNDSVSRREPGFAQKETRKGKACLPDHRLLRRICELRERRKRFFDDDLFADPAWDMLLDLSAARIESRRISVTSLCIASGVPATTALRWINIMVDRGLFDRFDDDRDKRRTFIALSDTGMAKVADYFESCGRHGIFVL